LRKEPLRVRVRVWAKINPTEDPEKLVKAFKNIVGERFSDRISVGEDVIVADIDGLDALAPIYEQVRARRTMAVLRRLLLENRVGNTSRIYINRQAAYAGIIVFAETEEESPLGPILLEIESNNLDELVEWLVPKREALRE